jgi:hypothetical protein
MADTVKPDAVEQAPTHTEEPADPVVSEPTKLIRIASMTRAMLDEVRKAPLDEGGRARLAEVHRKSLDELREVLSQELLDEFDEIMVPLDEEGVSEAELRIAQAQLIGWLEGLFHGIQASLWSQQMAAQAQLAEVQQRRLLPPGGTEGKDDASGLYL